MLYDGPTLLIGVALGALALWAPRMLQAFRRIFSKAGFSPWWGVNMAVPVVKLAALWAVGFLRRLDKR